MVLAQAPPPGAVVRPNESAGAAGGSVDGPPVCPGETEPTAVDHGVICAVAVCGPQIGGLVSGARGPPSNLRRKESNGTCGFSAKVVLSWPVCGSALTLPISGPSGRGEVVTETAPTFEAAGQATGFLVPLPNCLSAHDWRPFAADGLSPIPAGRLTVAVLRWEVSWSAPPLLVW